MGCSGCGHRFIPVAQAPVVVKNRLIRPGRRFIGSRLPRNPQPAAVPITAPITTSVTTLYKESK